jgi:hypothetical protein
MKITRNEYLQALALFTLASQHMRKVEEFELAMNEVLKSDTGSHASDALYCNTSFDSALKSMGITVSESLSPQPTKNEHDEN